MDVTLQPVAVDGSRRLALRAFRRRTNGSGPSAASLHGACPVDSRWARWAARLTGRYGVEAGWGPATALLLRRPALRATVRPQYIAGQRELRLSVTRPLVLSLRMLQPLDRHIAFERAIAPTPAASQAVRNPSQPLLRQAAPGAPPTPPAGVVVTAYPPAQAPRGIAVEARTALVERIVERVRPRDERGEPFAQASPVMAPPLRIFSRPAVPAAVAQPAGEASSIPATALRYWDPAPQPERSEQDVELLTDQVIRALDRRVVAARERFGKG